MKALLLVAHGSRRSESNDEIALLADRIEAINEGVYAHIRHAFLELAEPDIGTAIDALAALGATAVDVAPYFLSAGRHVSRDVPELIEQSAASHRAINFRILPHIGAIEGMPRLILQNAAA